jgi:DNA-binding Lrp family transcriptional regulator
MTAVCPSLTTDPTREARGGARRGSLGALERRLLDEYQRGFPLTPTPYADLARSLGVSEARVLRTLRSLLERGYVTRVGPVFRPNRAGASTLAALAVPPERLEAVAALVSGYPEVNHNYAREHAFNLWFVLTAPDRGRLDAVLREIEDRTGLSALDLPLEQDFHIDLGFPLWC